MIIHKNKKLIIINTIFLPTWCSVRIIWNHLHDGISTNVRRLPVHCSDQSTQQQSFLLHREICIECIKAQKTG